MSMKFPDAVVARFDQVVEGCHLYPNVVPATVDPPFAYYTERSTPVVTKDGIAGYETALAITVVASSKAEAQGLAMEVEVAFHGEDIEERTLWLESSEYTQFEKEKLHSYELTFNIL